MFWLIILCAAAAALYIVMKVIGYINYRRLHWSNSLSYYAYRRNVKRYMKRCGWTIDERTWLNCDFWANRGKERLSIILLPPGMTISPLKIKDLSRFGPDVLKGGRSLVCVTSSETPAQLVEDASRVNVRVLWYKELPRL